MFTRGVSISVGLLLAASAGLKLADIATGRDQSAWLWLDGVVVLFEFALGYGLVFAARRAGLWLLATLTFVVFVGFNLHAIRIGQASCGCFGSVTVGPWSALAIDLAALSGLTVWAVVDRHHLKVRPMLREAVGFVGGFGLSTLAWTVPVELVYGSVAAARAKMRGDEVYLGTTVIDVGPVSAGTGVESVLTVYNAGPVPVRLVGGTADCSCTLLPDLPAVIPPGGSYRLRVQLTVPAGHGFFQHRAKLWTDSQTNDLLRLTLRGRSVDGS